MRLKAAVVGLGAGREHAKVYASREDTELVALVDPVEARLKEVSAMAPARTYQDIESMLKDCHPDVVSIATPPHLHLAHSKFFLDEGVHVLVEKPLAATQEACDSLALLGESSKLVLMVAQKKRFIAPMRFIQERLGQDWGPIKVASVMYWLGRVELDWFWNEDQGGGPLVENSVHMIDLLRHLIGEVETVYAAGGNLFMSHRAPVPDVACVTLRFQTGAVASLSLGYGSEWGFATESLAFATDKASGRLSGPFDSPTELLWTTRGSGVSSTETFAHTSGFPEEIDLFLKAVRREIPNPVPARDAARSIAVCLAIKESLHTGAVVNLG